MSNEFIAICVFCFCTSCAKIDTLDLPDLDAKSFSSEEIIEKQKILEKRKDNARKLNQTERSNGPR